MVAVGSAADDQTHHNKAIALPAHSAHVGAVVHCRPMIGKILFTVAIIVGVILFVRWRAQRRPDVAQSHETEEGFRWLALAVVALMVIGSAIFVYQAWRDMSEVLEVAVVDAGSGKLSRYQVYRGDLEDREFRTVDGRRIILAETERIEIAAP